MPSCEPKIIPCPPLTPLEEAIFRTLTEAAKESGTIVRIAGGWVRDKLLGIESEDIDVAVDNMSGEEFAKRVANCMDGRGKQEITVVQANPEQSKHLATAMLYVGGRNIDFANLRKEDYADSRIPTIEPGTPYEDASRRDLTINSLFLNLNSYDEPKIEDYVGGYQDLKNKLARTPIDPIKTFRDDPLRILRTIRFASKYGLAIAYDIMNAAHASDVQLAIKTKVSAERIWKEIAGQGFSNTHWKPGFLNGTNPTGALVFAWKMQLMPFLFDVISPPPVLFALAPRSDYDPETTLVRYLAGMWSENTDRKTQKLLDKLKAPNNIARRVLKVKKHVDWDNAMSDGAFREQIVDIGHDWGPAADLSILLNDQPPSLRYRAQMLVDGMGGVIPKLPINGNDLQDMGIKPGPEMGKILTNITHEWYNNPKLTRDAALQMAKTT